MADGTPDGSALGLHSVEPPPDSGPDPLVDEPSTQEQEAPSTTDRPWDRQEPQAEQEVAPAPEGDGAERYGEDAYKKLQAAWTRDRQALLSMEQRQTQTEQVLEAMAPYMREMLSSQDPAFAQQYQLSEELKPFVDAQVQPIREQLEMQNQQMEAERVVTGFRSAHPDVAPGSQQDYEMSQVVQELGLRALNPESLEIGYEAWANPALRTVLRAVPTLIDTDEGMAYARLQAQQLTGSPAGTPGQQQPRQAGPGAFVETGGSGAPVRAAPGQRAAHDEFDDAFDAWAKERQSPLLGSLFRG